MTTPEPTEKSPTPPEERTAVEPDDDPVKKKYEAIFGLVISLFAAVLALNELASGKYGDDELQLTSERTSA